MRWDFLDQQLIIDIGIATGLLSPNSIKRQFIENTSTYTHLSQFTKERRKNQTSKMHDRCQLNWNEKGQVDARNWRSKERQNYGITVCGITRMMKLKNKIELQRNKCWHFFCNFKSKLNCPFIWYAILFPFLSKNFSSFFCSFDCCSFLRWHFSIFKFYSGILDLRCRSIAFPFDLRRLNRAMRMKLK